MPTLGHKPHVEARQWQQQCWLLGELQAQVTAGAQGFGGASGRAQQLGQGQEGVAIPVTRFKDMEEGAVILWPERTERGHYQGEGGPQAESLSRLGHPGERSHQAWLEWGWGLGCPSLGTLVLPGP